MRQHHNNSLSFNKLSYNFAHLINVIYCINLGVQFYVSLRTSKKEISMDSSARAAAKAIVATMKGLYGAPQTVVPANASQFGHLKLSEYDAFQSALEAKGFRSVGDVEILEVTQSPNTLIARTMIRSMISEDGTIYGGYYQVKPLIWRRLKQLVLGLINFHLGLTNFRPIYTPHDFISEIATRHYIDFETELHDGRFLITSNAEATASVSGPPSIESNYLPYATPTEALLKVHQSRLAKLLADSNDKPIILRSYVDIREMQKRQNTQKIAHRATVQWITNAELVRMFKGNVEQADEVFEEIKKLIAKERTIASMDLNTPVITARPVFIPWVTILPVLPFQLFMTVWAGGFFGRFGLGIFGLEALDPNLPPWFPFVFFGALVFFCILFIAYYATKKTYAQTEYRFYPDRLEYAEGFWTAEYKTIKYENIKETYLRTGIIQKKYGLGTIILSIPAMGTRSGIRISNIKNAEEIYNKVQSLIG
jgi:membrane protein YdbS with pleckstrin-like domain